MTSLAANKRYGGRFSTRVPTLVTGHLQWFVWQEMYMPTLKSMQIWPENFQDANDFWSASENGFRW